MEVDNVYQHAELKGRAAFRLIYLQPCEDLEAGVECSLKDASLIEYGRDIADHFIALSYVWGDQDDTRSILVDGKRLIITASLDSALRHIRDTRRVLRIWADGVCIDQKDVHDRSRQVRLMGDVYSTAQHTIIFLGTSSPGCDEVFQSIIDSELQFPSGGEQRSGVLYRSWDIGHDRIIDDEILSRPWFTRVWILQELVLSQNPWLQCGRHRIRWQVFCRRVLSPASPPFQPDGRAQTNRVILTDMNECRLKFKTAKDETPPKPESFPGETLLEMLLFRRGCALSDPLDMVYAHLGLVSYQTREMITIDYDKSVAQVYQDLAILYVQWAGLEITLSLVDWVQPEYRPSHLPSWITDWTTKCRIETPAFSRSSYRFKVPVPGSKNCSWAVPGVLAVIGDNCGTVDRTIMQSSWPEYETDDVHFSVKDLLQWLSRSDEEFLSSKQLLINLVAMQTPDKFTFRGYTHNYFKDPAWGQVASIISGWAPESPSQSELEGSKEREVFVEHFVNGYLTTMVDLVERYDRSDQLAVLDSGAIRYLPRLAKHGDVLIAVSRHTYLRDISSYYIIARPHKTAVPLSLTEHGQIIDDLFMKDRTCFKKDDRQIHHGYTFVSTANDLALPGKAGGPDELIKKPGKENIFTLI